MNDDELTIWDVERGILTGEILERQREPRTRDAKYRVRGQSIGGPEIEVIVKIVFDGTLVIITVYVCGARGKTMKCQICGRDGARIRRITETLGRGKDLLLVEDVPLVSCPHCGESYFTAETLHELERIRLHRTSFAVERPIGVARFAA